MAGDPFLRVRPPESRNTLHTKVLFFLFYFFLPRVVAPNDDDLSLNFVSFSLCESLSLSTLLLERAKRTELKPTPSQPPPPPSSQSEEEAPLLALLLSLSSFPSFSVVLRHRSEKEEEREEDLWSSRSDGGVRFANVLSKNIGMLIFFSIAMDMFHSRGFG